MLVVSDCDPGWRRWSWAVTFTFAFISFFISDQINRTALHDSYRSSSHITDLIMFWHHILYTWLCCFPSVCLQNHENTWTIKRLWVIDHTRWQSVCVCVYTWLQTEKCFLSIDLHERDSWRFIYWSREASLFCVSSSSAHLQPLFLFLFSFPNPLPRYLPAVLPSLF